MPKDIPTKPNQTYKNKGWIGWGDWLGTGTVATKLREYRPFEEARIFAHSLGIRSQKDWFSYCKGGFPEKETLPKDIPTYPNQTYVGDGWKSWGDWLGKE